MLEAVNEEGLHFLTEQAGEGQAEGDTTPDREHVRAEETFLEVRQSGEQDAEQRGTVEVSLGEEADFMKGIVPDHFGLVDPKQEMRREVTKSVNQEGGGFGPGTMKRQIEGLGEEASEA